MTLNKAGFPGSVNDIRWSKLMDLLGNDGGIGMNVSAAAGDRTASVSTGVRNVGGILADLDATQNVGPMPANVSTNPKINRIILRARWSDKSLTLTYREGTPGPNPQPPDLTPFRRPGDQYEVSLAQVRLEPGHGALTADDITRENTPPAVGVYYINSIAQAPREDGALFFYAPADALYVVEGDNHKELTSRRTNAFTPLPEPPPNWTGIVRYVKANRWVSVSVDLLRTGSTTNGATVKLGRLPAGFRPPITWFDVCFNPSVERTFTLSAEADGEVRGISLFVGTNQRLRGSITFPID